MYSIGKKLSSSGAMVYLKTDWMVGETNITSRRMAGVRCSSRAEANFLLEEYRRAVPASSLKVVRW